MLPRLLALTFLVLMGIPHAHAGTSSKIEMQFSLTWQNTLEGQSLSTDPLNPGNALLTLPSIQGDSELRPDFGATYGGFHLILRPRFQYLPTYTVVNGASTVSASQTLFTFNEANLQWSSTHAFILSYGLQNFQWGPAETLSPSNQIFHETVLDHTPLYLIRGRHLFRANVSPNQSWSFILLTEITDNGEPAFIAETPFEPKALLKIEYNWNSGSSYSGLVLGDRRDTGPWVGEYLNVPLSEGWTFYFDVAEQSGSPVWYPVAKTITTPQGPDTVVVPAQSALNNGRLYATGVGGFRYAFENGSDFRIEYIYNGQGYNSAQYSLIRQAAGSQDPYQQLSSAGSISQFLASGLEFPGIHLGYVSLRIPDFLGVRDLVLYNRYLHSLTDQSGVAYSQADLAVGKAGTVFGAFGFNHGAPEAELAGFTETLGILGYRYAW
jgi:hypothetical protein